MEGFSAILFVLIALYNSDSAVGQTEESEAYLKDLCKNRGPGEWFRLEVKDCRDVYQCTEGGLQALRCPSGLAFDLEIQGCDWKNNVKNCGEKHKKIRVQPKLNTPEPLCENSDTQLACGDGVCMARELFCDGNPDCADESDETFCDINSDPNAAPPCDKQQCHLPNCYCYHSPVEVPTDIPVKQIPQMVLISFDDAVNNNNMDLYEYIFTAGRVNPNQCTIKATFFVSHKYTNYTAVQELDRLGNEIAVHSISHNDSDYWSKASKEQWAAEMAAGREILKNFANMSDTQIIGMRSPYLRVGGNNQFKMMEEHHFVFDSTITAPLNNPPYWPYMLHYRMPHVCHGNLQKCPTRSFNGWEMVMNELDRREDPINDPEQPGCAMVDSCFSTKPTPEQFRQFMWNNFDRHYESNRAPLGLFLHSPFLKNDPGILDTFLEWIDQVLLEYKDVYFVTMSQALHWLQDPRPVSELENFEAWKYPCVPTGEPACPFSSNNCELTSDELPGETNRLPTCMPCPNNYPWVNDPHGLGSNTLI